MKHFEDDPLYKAIETQPPHQHEYTQSNYAKQVTAEMREIAERSRAPKEETEAYVTLYFVSREDKLAFLKALGIDKKNEYYINGYDFAELIGRPMKQSTTLRTAAYTKKKEKRDGLRGSSRDRA